MSNGKGSKTRKGANFSLFYQNYDEIFKKKDKKYYLISNCKECGAEFLENSSKSKTLCSICYNLGF